MIRKIIITTLLLVVSYSIISAQPDWVDLHKRELAFPKDHFYVAFSETYFDKKDDLNAEKELVKHHVLSQLSGNILLLIKSTTTLQKMETEETYASYFKNSIQTESTVELKGVKPDIYVDQKKRIIYALAYIKKENLFKHYVQKLNNKLTALEQKTAQTQQFLDIQNQTEAQESYTQAQVLMNECEVFGTIVNAISLTAVTDEINRRMIAVSQQLSSLMVELKSSENRSINDLANILFRSIKSQIDENYNLKIAYLSYGDTDFTSPFSIRFHQSIVQAISIDKQFTPIEEVSSNDLILIGNYWEEGDNLLVSLLVKNQKGEILGAANDIINKLFLSDAGINFKAENFAEAYSRLQEFSKDEILYSGLNVELWTNKGNENLMYQEGEIMQLYVRVNAPTYLRIIYYLADGSKVLLLDNYYIDQSKINKVVELPDEFESSEPFGYETLQLNAQTRPFLPLETTIQYGYDFINESTQKIIANSRGLKKVDNSDLQAEIRLNITTFK